MHHFLDIGANVGQTFDEFLCHDNRYDGWTVWCFEPSVRHLPELQQTIEKYSNRYQIKLCPFGVSGFTSIQPFWLKDDPRGDSFEAVLASDHLTNNLNFSYSMMGAAMGIEQVLRLIPDWDSITMKLDCEGSEYSILEALLRSPEIHRVKELYAEFHIIGSPHRSAPEIVAEYANHLPIKPWVL